IHSAAPAQAKDDLVVADLRDHVVDKAALADAESGGRRRRPTLNEPAWRGTILPATDADAWLAAAFADYERIVSTQNSLKDVAKDDKAPSQARERLGLDLFGYRASYLAGARASQDVPLAKIRAETSNDYWYRIAAGKGVLALHAM